MIQTFVKAWDERGTAFRDKFKTAHPEDYKAIVRAVIEVLSKVYEYGSPDPERIHTINDGDYQGTLVFVVGAEGYQPDRYWAVKVSYGSCSGCDTLEAVRGYSDEPPNDEQLKEYETLGLHIIQGLHEIGAAPEERG